MKTQRRPPQCPKSLRRLTAGVLEFAGHFGVLRLLAPGPDPTPDRFTRDQWAEIWTLRWQPKSVLAAARDAVGVSAAQARAAGSFGDLPLIVLTAGKSGFPNRTSGMSCRPNWHGARHVDGR